MSTILEISADLEGSTDYQWSGLTIGGSTQYNFTCYDPADQSEFLSLTAITVTMTIKAISTTGQPTGAAIFADDCTVTDAAGGECYVLIPPDATAPLGVAIAAGWYVADVWAEDVSGNRLLLTYGQIQIGPAVGLP